jgi:hypothetical protein
LGAPRPCKLICWHGATLTRCRHHRIDALGSRNSASIHLRCLSGSRHHTTSLWPRSGSRIHLRSSSLRRSGCSRSINLGPRCTRRTRLWRGWPRGSYLRGWNSSSGRAVERRLHYVGRELTPALRHGDEAKHVEELGPAEEAGLVLIGVHPNLHAHQQPLALPNWRLGRSNAARSRRSHQEFEECPVGDRNWGGRRGV